MQEKIDDLNRVFIILVNDLASAAMLSDDLQRREETIAYLSTLKNAVCLYKGLNLADLVTKVDVLYNTHKDAIEANLERHTLYSLGPLDSILDLMHKTLLSYNDKSIVKDLVLEDLVREFKTYSGNKNIVVILYLLALFTYLSDSSLVELEEAINHVTQTK